MKYEEIAKRIIEEESKALAALAENIPSAFGLLVDYILNSEGKVICTGMGKSGYIARKIAASLTSTGTPAIYLHPAEASHGDLGIIGKKDIIIALSNSGETKELNDILDYAERNSIKLASFTGNTWSNLAKKSDFHIYLPCGSEASKIGAPTTSAILSLAAGDALCVALQEFRGFTEENFRLLHPGGEDRRENLIPGALLNKHR